jgi:glycolate oxidase FAD binding subunit
MIQQHPALIPWTELVPDAQAQLRTAIPIAPIVGMATPQTQAELADTIRSAAAKNWQVLPYGNGSKLDWAGLVGDSRSILAIQLAQMHQLIDHAMGDMTVTVEAGMRFADLQATLATSGQCLPVDPRFGAEATIGGVIATADTGSLRHRYNGVRDLLLGVTFVRADGELVKAGGRVVKNVAGYDLMKLLTGAYGTLGVISQVTLRVYPLPPLSQTVVLTGEGMALAQLAQTVLSSTLTPTAIDWLNPTAMTELGLRSGMGLIVRFQTVAESIAEQSKRLREWAQQLNITAIVYPEVDEADLWQRIGAIGETGAVICKMGAKGTAASILLPKIAEIAPAAMAIVHAGSGVGRLVLPDASDVAATRMLCQVAEIRTLCQAAAGYLSILRAPVAVKQAIDLWGDIGNAVELMQAVKQQFDPDRVFSPHRFVGGI